MQQRDMKYYSLIIEYCKKQKKILNKKEKEAYIKLKRLQENCLHDFEVIGGIVHECKKCGFIGGT